MTQEKSTPKLLSVKGMIREQSFGGEGAQFPPAIFPNNDQTPLIRFKKKDKISPPRRWKALIYDLKKSYHIWSYLIKRENVPEEGAEVSGQEWIKGLS